MKGARRFAVSRPTEPVQRSNCCRRWHASLAQKGLAAFQPVSVTLSLPCLRQTSPVDWTNMAKTMAKTDAVLVIDGRFSTCNQCPK
jgi:hypothetical protein